jgi:hypothetical protein
MPKLHITNISSNRMQTNSCGYGSVVLHEASNFCLLRSILHCFGCGCFGFILPICGYHGLYCTLNGVWVCRFYPPSFVAIAVCTALLVGCGCASCILPILCLSLSVLHSLGCGCASCILPILCLSRSVLHSLGCLCAGFILPVLYLSLSVLHS